MGEILDFSEPADFPKLAVEKIDTELGKFEGNRYGQAVKDFVASTLKNFCGQDPRFAEVVYRTKRTLSDCCASIMEGCGSHISDIDVYRGAVRFYFPNSDICFTMNIDLTGEPPTEEEMAREAPVKKAGNGKPAQQKTKKRENNGTSKGASPNPEKENTPAEKRQHAPAQRSARKPSGKAENNDDMIQLTLF